MREITPKILFALNKVFHLLRKEKIHTIQVCVTETEGGYQREKILHHDQTAKTS
jgi:hypothetical protein